MGTVTKIQLPIPLGDRGSKGLAENLRRAILALPADSPLLRLAGAQGGLIQEGVKDATVLGIEREGASLIARVGIFFTETVGGCSCGDEPFTSDGYCELSLRIDQRGAEAEVSLT
jgi:hypothetical protein